jgi:hypothetical protein
MKVDHSIPVLAVVTVNERAIVEEAARRLGNALSQATGEIWECHCSFAPDLKTVCGAPSGSVIITSLGVPLEQLDAPWAEIEQSLRSSYAALGETGEPVMICTIFRHVATTLDPEKADHTLRRLRQFNLLATELSREYGALVIDLDRVLADIGGRRLSTDHRLGGATVVDVASGWPFSRDQDDERHDVGARPPKAARLDGNRQRSGKSRSLANPSGSRSADRPQGSHRQVRPGGPASRCARKRSTAVLRYRAVIQGASMRQR